MLTLAATGDSIITRRLTAVRDPAFIGLTALLRGADAAFTNLEITTPQPPMVPAPDAGLNMSAPAWVLDELRGLGLNLFAVATNHAVDYTFRGLMDTLEALRSRGLVHAGGGATLGEARAPAYLETPSGRVALLAAASSYSPGALGADPRPDALGRPGINPLRVVTDYVLDPRRMAMLKEIDEALGTAGSTRWRQRLGIYPDPGPGITPFAGARFAEGESPHVRTRPHPRDMAEIERWIGDARRQAGLVAVSLHAHHGQAGYTEDSSVADYLVEVAHRCIDAGADAFLGHGPHVLRPIEIYRGKPIFYSLGNFLFQYETMAHYPAEMYEREGIGPEGTPADKADAWALQRDGSPSGMHADPAYWESVVAVARFQARRLTALDLHPIVLGRTQERPERGTPVLASPEDGRRILAQLAEISAPYGTRFHDGHVLLE
ncbi:MAG TPA: CapA family protein [Bacillota bacterium]|nr:CapA family protein [Bacillota bacterium]